MSNPLQPTAPPRNENERNLRSAESEEAFQLATYPGTGTSNTENYHYSQAVEIRSNRLFKTSGQGGWDDKSNIYEDIQIQVEKAFENAMTALKELDRSITWKNVYSIQSFHVDMDATFDIVVNTTKKLMPDHKPIWTCVAVPQLGIKGMMIEVVIEAAI